MNSFFPVVDISWHFAFNFNGNKQVMDPADLHRPIWSSILEDERAFSFSRYYHLRHLKPRLLMARVEGQGLISSFPLVCFISIC